VIIRLDPTSAVPTYAQVHDQIATMVRSGVLPADTRLPAIRHLANDLGVAVNTVGRAYRELERDGLVVPRGRHGTVVLPPADAPLAEREQDLTDVAAAFAIEATHRGIDLGQALEAVRTAFGGLDDRKVSPDQASFPS